MALTPRLDLRQAQTLVMTPQLQQAIKLLQFSSLELAAYVDQQLEENPFLERGEGETDGAAAEPTSAAGETGEPRSLDQVVSDDPGVIGDGDLDLEVYDNVFDTADGASDTAYADGAGGGRQERGGSFDESDPNLEAMVAERITLRDHLLAQVAVDLQDPVDRLIAVQLVDMLDDAGYLSGDLAAVAELLGCSLERVEQTLLLAQRMDPPGVFARSLSECLALQLADRGTIDPAMAVVLANLDMVARRDWTTLARLADVRSERLGELLVELRALNPKPASAFDHDVAAPIIPDIFMRAKPSGDWLVELNPEALPRVLVNNTYYAQITRTTRTSKQDKQYINECLQSANWLVKSLHQRATTILKVATEIIRQQEGFFISGVRGLKPLVLRDIADAIGMHESTVSRVTSNKFMATPRGIFELKYFFTHGIGGTKGGEIHSAESVRYRIKLLIDTEVTTTVLSDDALAEILQKEGIDIARRTVAKYREAMGIPSSVQRRRLKSAEL